MTARPSISLLTLYNALLALALIFPLAVVLVVSLTSASYLSFPPPGLSLKWYAALLQRPDFMASFQASVAAATLSMILSLLVGLPAALGLRQLRGPLAVALQTLFLSPLMLPTIVIGIGLLEAYQAVGLRTSTLMLALGQTLIGAPYVVRLVLASLAGVDPATERAARNLGAGPWRTLARVTLPACRQGVIAGALFAFVMSLDDVSIALFLADVHTTTLPVRMFTYIEQNTDPLANAAASLLAILALVLIVIGDRIVGIEWLFGINAQRSGV